MKRGVVVLVLGLVFAAFVWPGRFRYEQGTMFGRPALIRIDRITGDASYLSERAGWLPTDTWRP
jgi:hypothetical protein